MTDEQVELGARALFELEKYGHFANLLFIGGADARFEDAAPALQHRWREQARAVLRAAGR
jgi:hypothetical protein